MKNQHPATRKTAMSRVQILLKSIMLRRQKTSEVDGQPICTIPPKHTELANVEFSDPEHELYKALETKSQLQFNKYLEKNTVSGKFLQWRDVVDLRRIHIFIGILLTDL